MHSTEVHVAAAASGMSRPPIFDLTVWFKHACSLLVRFWASEVKSQRTQGKRTWAMVDACDCDARRQTWQLARVSDHAPHLGSDCSVLLAMQDF